MEPNFHAQQQVNHTPNHLDEVFRRSTVELERLRKDLKGSPNLAKKEREFMIKEIAKLKCMGKLQASLDTYRQTKQSVPQREMEAKSKKNSSTLGDHLRADGHFKPGANWDAHHIVCSRHGSHASARLVLFAFLGINDPHNGVWLPKYHGDAKHSVTPNAVGHKFIHTMDYADWILEQLGSPSGTGAIIRRLRIIRMKLLNAKTYPEVTGLLTKNGKNDLGVI